MVDLRAFWGGVAAGAIVWVLLTLLLLAYSPKEATPPPPGESGTAAVEVGRVVHSMGTHSVIYRFVDEGAGVVCYALGSQAIDCLEEE